MATDITDPLSSIEGEYETADDHFGTDGEYNTDEYGSDTPNAFLSELEDQEWHDSPVIPRTSPEDTPKPSQRTWTSTIASARDPFAAVGNMHKTTMGGGNEMSRDIDTEMTPKATRPHIQIPYSPSPKTNPRDPSFTDTESLHSLSRHLSDDDDDVINTPIFAQPHTITPPKPTTPVSGTVIPSASPIIPSHRPVDIDINVIPPGSSGTIDSEASWLSGKMDIQNAVRKSFHGSPVGKSPILLDASAGDSSALGLIDPKGLWKPDYRGEEYEQENMGDEMVERVRQGSKARKVEVVNSPGLEGLEARLSGESPERRATAYREGGIPLFRDETIA